MDLQAAMSLAKQHIEDAFAAEAPRDVRLESFLYDDHLMIWLLTIGFSSANSNRKVRVSKLVRVSEANRAVLSINDP